MIIIGIDDTDTLESRGTGSVARAVARELATDYDVAGVIRHQLLRDPRVPCTKNNSSKAVLVRGDAADGSPEIAELTRRVREVILGDFVPGSDPGLCVAGSVSATVVQYGRRVQRELVTQADARILAATCGLYLEGLGGDEMGVIGALAAVGLTAGGDAGRYIQIGRCRDLTGLQPIEALIAAGIDSVQTRGGEPVREGLVLADNLRPARRGGMAVAVVERADGHWAPVRLD